MAEAEQNVRTALEQDPDIDIRDAEITLEPDGVIRLGGEVGSIVAKRRARLRAAAAAGTRRIKDDLRVLRETRRSDRELAGMFEQALRADPVFRDLPIAVTDGAERPDRSDGADEPAEGLSIQAHDGVLHIAGEVPSLSHRRLAEVIGWWIPGVVDVDNRLHVQPPEEDNDGEIRDAIRIVFDKDPTLDAEEIQILVRDAVVTLGGRVANARQGLRAEENCWYVPGVHDVHNTLYIVSS